MMVNEDGQDPMDWPLMFGFRGRKRHYFEEIINGDVWTNCFHSCRYSAIGLIGLSYVEIELLSRRPIYSDQKEFASWIREILHRAQQIAIKNRLRRLIVVESPRLGWFYTDMLIMTTLQAVENFRFDVYKPKDFQAVCLRHENLTPIESFSLKDLCQDASISFKVRYNERYRSVFEYIERTELVKVSDSFNDWLCDPFSCYERYGYDHAGNKYVHSTDLDRSLYFLYFSAARCCKGKETVFAFTNQTMANDECGNEFKGTFPYAMYVRSTVEGKEPDLTEFSSHLDQLREENKKENALITCLRALKGQ